MTTMATTMKIVVVVDYEEGAPVVALTRQDVFDT